MAKDDERDDSEPDRPSTDGKPAYTDHYLTHGALSHIRHRVSEESVLLASLVKWSALAACAGAAVGLTTALFIRLLEWTESLTRANDRYHLLLPLGMLVSAVLVKYLAPRAAGQGTEQVIAAVHDRSGRMGPQVGPVKLIATVFTIGTGGSAGKQAPSAQIGAGLCSVISDVLRLDDGDRRKLVICGICGGFAAVFGTPVAGALFGIEVLFCGHILYDILLPASVAGMTSYHVASLLGVTYIHQPMAARCRRGPHDRGRTR